MSQQHPYSLMRFADTALAEEIEQWRRQQERIPTISGALRALVSAGLAVEKASSKQEKAA